MQAGEQKLFELAGQEIPRQIIHVVDNVYFLRGYGASNAIAVIGENSIILIDALENDAVAKIAKNELVKITDKPIKTIIYTHTHADHTSGAGIFADKNAQIISAVADKVTYGNSELLKEIALKRAIMQFGSMLTPQEALSSGLAPCSSITGKDATLPSNFWVKNSVEEKVIDGVLFRFYKAVGETDDQMYVYLPKQDVLCCGDNYYRSWPNLSAPRGSQYRDISSWIDSLQIILDISPKYLLNGHSDMIIGKDNIILEIKPYKDAIEYVLKETLKAMNEGLTVEEIVEKVALPQNYQKLPQLQELYGMVDWAIRGIYCGYLGWFDGNPTNLHLCSLKKRAEKRIALAGGVENIIAEINCSFIDEEYQWILELCDDLINARQEIEQAKKLKANALEALAYKQVNANSRHIYLTASKELKLHEK